MCERRIWLCLSTFISELLHYHVIILYSYTDVDWCSDRECEDTGLRYVCLPPLFMSLYCVPSQTWTGVARPPSTAVTPTGTVRTRDLATSVYHHYHVIILSFSQTWTGVCSGTSQHSFLKGFGYVCLPPLSRHYTVFLHRRGLV